MPASHSGGPALLNPDLEEALEALESGLVVVIPTDTVYGVAARPAIASAVDAVFEAKRRPREKPLPVLAASIEDLAEVVVVTDDVKKLASEFWPGPLTLVLERVPGFDHDLGGAGGTVAVRVPRNSVARELLARSGPLAVTSANASGGRPATTIDQAREDLGNVVAVYIDDGTCNGSPSTVATLAPDVAILRAGPIGLEELAQTLMS